MAGKLRLAPPPSGAGSLTVSEAVEAFLAALEAAGASPSTLRAYRAALESFRDFVGGDTRVSELTPAHYTEWLRRLRRLGPRRPRSSDPRAREATIHFYSVYVRRLLSWLGVAEGLPAAPRGRRGYSGALAWGDVERLLEAARDLVDAVIVALLAESGLRARELLGLRVADVDLAAGVIRVVGKYGKERMVPLGPMGRILVSELIRSKQLGPGDRLIPITYQALYKRLKSLAARAGIDPARVRPHVLRHTFATEALRRGVSLPALQRLLGHSDVKVTQLYLHLVWEDVRREYERAFHQAPAPQPPQWAPPWPGGQPYTAQQPPAWQPPQAPWQAPPSPWYPPQSPGGGGGHYINPRRPAAHQPA